MTQCIAIIPARYDSTRLPGKPLLDIGGKTLLQRVYEQVVRAAEIDRIIIATDDERIETHARQLGAEVEMTFRSHKSGTERCAQVARQFWTDDIIINVQGDEPFIDPKLIDHLARVMLEDDWIGIASYRTPILDENVANNPNNVKVVASKDNKALYFSRQTIPFGTDPAKTPTWYKHMGIYGYKNKILQEITTLQPTPLEQAEKLEQLRWLENGYAIHMLTADHESLGIDTFEDLELARQIVNA